MKDEILEIIKCPIDPERATSLHRERECLVCDQCQVKYPIKQGIPILLPDEAELPEGVDKSQLPCMLQLRARRRERRAKRE